MNKEGGRSDPDENGLDDAEALVVRRFSIYGEGAGILASLQYHLIAADIEAEQSRAKGADNQKQWWQIGKKTRSDFVNLVHAKEEWKQKWLKVVRHGFDEGSHQVSRDKKAHLLTDGSEFSGAVQRYAEETRLFTRGLILLELASWLPYFPLDKDGSEKSLELNLEVKNRYLDRVSVLLGMPSKALGRNLVRALQTAHRDLTDIVRRVLEWNGIGTLFEVMTAGLAAPFLAGGTGAVLGLRDGAALTAAMGALGAGTSAIHGLGASEKAVVIIGGGSLLGLSMEATRGSYDLMNTPREELVASLLKLDVAFEQLVLGLDRDPELAVAVIKIYRRLINRYERLYDDEVFFGGNGGRKMKVFQEKIRLWRRALDRLHRRYSKHRKGLKKAEK